MTVYTVCAFVCLLLIQEGPDRRPSVPVGTPDGTGDQPTCEYNVIQYVHCMHVHTLMCIFQTLY